MVRQRKLSMERRAFINIFIEDYHPDGVTDVQNTFKGLLGNTLLGCWKLEC